MNALFQRIDRVANTRALGRALLMLVPTYAAALITGDSLWLQATLVTISVFIAAEQTRLAPLGVALHGLATIAGFLILLTALPFASLFAVLAATMAAGAILLTAKGQELRTLGNYTFIPALYLAIELGEPGSGSGVVRGLAFLPYAVFAILPVLALSATEHGRELEPNGRLISHFHRLRRRGAKLGTAAPCGEAAAAAALAVVAAALLVEWQHIPHAQWAVWSAASVVTGEVTSARRKLTDRTLGALVGVPVGVICALVTPNAIALLRLAEIGIVLTLVGFRVYRIGFGARCACVAFTLAFAGQWAGAAERVVNVALGGVLGLTFVLAIHAIVMTMKGRPTIAHGDHQPLPLRVHDCISAGR